MSATRPYAPRSAECVLWTLCLSWKNIMWPELSLCGRIYAIIILFPCFMEPSFFENCFFQICSFGKFKTRAACTVCFEGLALFPAYIVTDSWGRSSVLLQLWLALKPVGLHLENIVENQWSSCFPLTPAQKSSSETTTVASNTTGHWLTVYTCVAHLVVMGTILLHNTDSYSRQGAKWINLSLGDPVSADRHQNMMCIKRMTFQSSCGERHGYTLLPAEG